MKNTVDSVSLSRAELASRIDSTLLAPTATKASIEDLVRDAVIERYASVCVNPYWVSTAYTELVRAQSPVHLCTVVGFPLGATSTASKVYEAETAIRDGATELDMVMNIGAFKSGDEDSVRHDIGAVVAAGGGNAGPKVIVKVILEICLLDDREIVRACELARAAGADFVKTSTGFSTGGATVEAVKLMRRVVGDSMGVKAAGGIRDAMTFHAMLAAGASRVGASAGRVLLEGAPRDR